MQELIRHPRHLFWPDVISLLAAPGGEAPLVDVTQLLEAGQLTDSHLLALAVHHGGTLVSFDRRLGCGAVAGGSDAPCLIPT